MGTISTPLCFSSSSSSWTTQSKSTPLNPQSTLAFHFPSGAVLSTFAPPPRIRDTRSTTSLFPLHFSPRASSSSSSSSSTVDYREEATTKVKFPTSLSLPGSSTSLSLLGTGYREKVFAIIGVKVYAAGLYVNQSIIKELDAWKGRSALEIQGDPSLFASIFQVPLEKSLDVILVRDVDGKTFWDALNEALSPRIKSPTPVDETALSTFRDIFQGRSLKKGTLIFLTWLNPTKMLVCVSSEGSIPSDVDATIESTHVPMALFDVFFGSEPVSPSLKASVSNGLASLLK